MTGLVHVGDTDALRGLANALDMAGQDASQHLNTCLSEAAEQMERIRAGGACIQQRLEMARDSEARCSDALATAEGELDRAEAALASCEAQPPDKDGYKPSCSSEESDVAAAEAHVADARQTLEEAVRAREAWERRSEEAAQIASSARQQAAHFQQTIDSAAAQIPNIVERAQAFLYSSAGKIEAYGIGGAPSSGTLPQGVSSADRGINAATPIPQTAGLSGTVQIFSGGSAVTLPSLAVYGAIPLPAQGVIRPSDLAAALKIPAERMLDYLRGLASTDLRFRAEVERRRGELRAASGPADSAAVFTRVRRHTAGLLAERLVLAALAPLAQRTETQQRALTPALNATITDAVFQNLRFPLVLGRGAGRLVPVGCNLRVEVKARQKDALRNELTHLKLQVSARGANDRVLAIVTRDVHDLGEEGEAALREGLEEEGAPILALLPRKDELDEACWNLISSEDGP